MIMPLLVLVNLVTNLYRNNDNFNILMTSKK